MKPRTAGVARASRVGALGFTALALVLTALTAWLLSRLLGDRYAAEPVRDVVVAARDIPAAERILDDHLRIVQLPVSSIPPGAYTSKDQLISGEARVPVSSIFAGEAILPGRLASAKAGTGMGSLVPPDMRAFAVPIDGWMTQARLVYPGAWVDVITTIRDGMDRSVTTRLVLQRLRVLAVEGDLDAAAMAAREQRRATTDTSTGTRSVVTLLVTPEEAELLALAGREGKIDLMLRNAGDDTRVDTFGMTPGLLLGKPEPEPDPLAGMPGYLQPSHAPAAPAAAVAETRRRVAPAPPAPRLSEAERRRAIESDRAPAAQPPSGSGSVKTIRLGVN